MTVAKMISQDCRECFVNPRHEMLCIIETLQRAKLNPEENLTTWLLLEMLTHVKVFLNKISINVYVDDEKKIR